ncbi:MAG TPA: CBS domain-containing protein [Blastocatellia bacterium]|nr:CBS domain-containing protein [Blastocatellia bacterium]
MAARYNDQNYERGRHDRGSEEGRRFIDRAGDEVRSWFGNEEAARRRRMDEMWVEQHYREGQYAGSQYEFEDVRTGEVMTRNVITVYPDDSIERAARLMTECDCGALPVVDRNGRLIGMVTDRDITVRSTARGIDPRRSRVAECMTDEAIACHVNDSIRNCMRQMSRHQIRRIPIVNDRYEVIGIISQGDLARHAATYQGRGERRALADVMCAVSRPTHAPHH